MKSFEQDLDESTRLAETDPGKRVTMTAEAYNALQKDMDHAMAEVYAYRLGEIQGASPSKGGSRCIVATRIDDTKQFSFGQAFLPYLVVRDKFALSGYGSDHSVNVITAHATVHAEFRRNKNCVWDTHCSFGTDGTYKVLLGELTVDAARKAANSLVDYVRDSVVIANHYKNLKYQSQVPPFMTTVAGHVLIHDGVKANPLPEEWTGICVDGGDSTKHWYIGRSGGERSFSVLAAKTMRAAILESQAIVKFEAEEAKPA